ncbi:MAG TPA: prepilin-type N-terminal cleavage/methylation domain-containing protein [Desulfovibrio sp.]|uniref:type II secretion system protein n=1 Tax=Desulfovibrio sp. TaxID=885 RepID=UPI002C099CD1|nr:prepilin-type N-terminal cleavage/methylation domain-containing protein [Desulfovibrio sp.]HMM37473.1 prepilin-type N-terminal cleavage/methylation domain-containing protein [Desulfovibrio sp.]
MSRENKRKQGGFTLIELISVIIILGILAAVITPKYFDMTSKATEAAGKGAFSEGVGRLNLAYSRFILDNNQVPGTDAASGLALLQTNSTYLGPNPVDLGDYRLQYAVDGTTDIRIEVYRESGNTLGALVYNATLPWPTD